MLSDFVASLNQPSSSSESVDTIGGHESSIEGGAGSDSGFTTGVRTNVRAIKQQQQQHKKKEAYQRPHSRMSVGTTSDTGRSLSRIDRAMGVSAHDGMGVLARTDRHHSLSQSSSSSSTAYENTTTISEQITPFHRPITTSTATAATITTVSSSAWVGGGVCVPISRLKNNNNNNNNNEGNKPIDVSLQEQGLGCCFGVVMTTMDSGKSGGKGGTTATSSSSSSSSSSSLNGQQQQGPSTDSITSTCFLDKEQQQQQQQRYANHHRHKSYLTSEQERNLEKGSSSSGTDGVPKEGGDNIPLLPPFHCLPLTETYQPHTPLQSLATSICTTASDCRTISSSGSSSSSSSGGSSSSSSGGDEGDEGGASEEYRYDQRLIGRTRYHRLFTLSDTRYVIANLTSSVIILSSHTLS